MNILTVDQFSKLDLITEMDIENAAIDFFNSEMSKVARIGIKKYGVLSFLHLYQTEKSLPFPEMVLNLKCPNARANVNRIVRSIQDKLMSAGWYKETGNSKHGVLVSGSKVVTLREVKIKITFTFISENTIH